MVPVSYITYKSNKGKDNNFLMKLSQGTKIFELLSVFTFSLYFAELGVVSLNLENPIGKDYIL